MKKARENKQQDASEIIRKFKSLPMLRTDKSSKRKLTGLEVKYIKKLGK